MLKMEGTMVENEKHERVMAEVTELFEELKQDIKTCQMDIAGGNGDCVAGALLTVEEIIRKLGAEVTLDCGGLCVKLTKEEIKAIDDANDYVYNVADDRNNAYIDYDRKEAVYKILRDLLDRINTYLSGGLSMEQPTEPGYYWWLPECYLEHRDDDRYWTIIRCHPNDGESRVGLFEGPLKR
jgi:hypothetical protein